ncbi:MAG: SusC/RagA family TonB-linked outer membrane protein, partial [Ginsengibacter sp.]
MRKTMLSFIVLKFAGSNRYLPKAKIILVVAAMFCLAFNSTAQNRLISGVVTDEKGITLPDISVIVKGAKTGTTSGSDGSFRLTFPSKAKSLIISSVGLQTQEIIVGNETNFNITLKASNKSMEEVIVVGYGTVKKGDFTGSSAQVSAKDIEKRPITNVTNALVGSAPGIQTTSANGAPGSSANVRIRGFNSISAGSAPLFVVDGVPYDGGLANINPDDVESITTLKDASTTALFGSRGANGVILITTKKGKKNNNQITFRMSQGFSERGIPEYDKVNAFQYYPLMWEAYRNSLAYSSTIPLATASQTASSAAGVKARLGYNPFNVADNDIVRTDGTLNPAAQLLYGDDLDWENAATRNATRKDYMISYSGGNDKSDFFTSMGYTDESGYLIDSRFKRFTGRIGVNSQPINWFKVGVNISGTTSKNDRASDLGNSIVNPFTFSRNIGPIYPVFAHDQMSGAFLLDANGNKIYDYGNLAGQPSRPYNPGRHTIAENLLNEDLDTRSILSGRANGEIIFTPSLRFTTNISVDMQNLYRSQYQNKFVGDGAPAGRAQKRNQIVRSYTFNQLLNYAKKFGSHNFTFLAGHENYDLKINTIASAMQGQIVDGNTEYSNFTTISSLFSLEDNKRIESYLSRLTYDFAGKYFLSGSVRRDGNSQFSKAVRWENFWALGAAWRLDKESFLKVSWLDALKLRASYGKVGNDATLNADGTNNYYPYQALYALGFNNISEPGFVQNSLANDSLTWESSKSFDLGIDFGLFKNRLSGTVEYFNKVTDRLIFNVPQPLSNGGTTGGGLTIQKNIGTMVNKGFEVQLTGDVLRTKDFTWNMVLNWTTFKNEITKMPVETPEIIQSPQKLAVGHSIFEFWTREFFGVDP